MEPDDGRNTLGDGPKRIAHKHVNKKEYEEENPEPMEFVTPLLPRIRSGSVIGQENRHSGCMDGTIQPTTSSQYPEEAFVLPPSQEVEDALASGEDSGEDSEGELVGDALKIKRRTGCRKEKSLGLLCQRFLQTMREETAMSRSKSVHLETIAKKMSVEKRRIYDIVNVMEALDAMSKLNKSFYCWRGLNHLPNLMQELQRDAIEEDLPSRILRVEQAMCSFVDLSPGSRRKDLVGSVVDHTFSSTPTTASCSPYTLASPLTSPILAKNASVVVSTSSSTNISSGGLTYGGSESAGGAQRSGAASEASSSAQGSQSSTRSDRGGRNSLALLCRRFLMVLLAHPQDNRKVSLDVASTVLIKDPETEGFDPPSRGRCRRLYDIANVLVAMGIIKKVHYLFGTKKIPLFIYSGPEPDEKATLSEETLQEMMMHPSKDTEDAKGFGKRSDASDMSPASSPNNSCIMTAAERNRLLQSSGSSFVVPLSPGQMARRRTVEHIPSSPLASTDFLSPRSVGPLPPVVSFRNSETAGATVFIARPAPRTMPYSSHSTPNMLNATAAHRPPPSPHMRTTWPSTFSSPNASSPTVLNRHPSPSFSSSTPSLLPACRSLAPLESSASSASANKSPKQMASPLQQPITPAHSIRKILGVLRSPAGGPQQAPPKSPPQPRKSLAAVFAGPRDNEEEENRSLDVLEHHGTSLFRVVKREKSPSSEKHHRLI